MENGGPGDCSPLWHIDPQLSHAGITCLKCVLDCRDCSFQGCQWNVALWPRIIKTGIEDVVRRNATLPNGNGDTDVQGHEFHIVLPHLNAFEERLQDPAETEVSLQTHQMKLREILDQEEREAAALRALVDSRKPTIERLVQMFDQALEGSGWEAT